MEHWNRIYGSQGFVQHQCVLPPAGAQAGLSRMLDLISARGAGSFLAVLKLMGEGTPGCPLSFPMPGWTLALDFKATAANFNLLAELDGIVADHGGRLYLAKDRARGRLLPARLPGPPALPRPARPLRSGAALPLAAIRKARPLTEILGPVLIIGAHSDIARCVAAEYARAGVELILAARHSARLEGDAADLSIRAGCAARAVELDVTDVDPRAFFDSLGETPRTVVSVVGLLGDQARAQEDAAHARTLMETNYVGPCLILAEAAERLARGGLSGAIIGVGSVAGDRGRKTNYAYGSAKAGFAAFLSGMRHRFAGSGVLVMTVKPGFVRTAMTAGMTLPKALTAEPDEVGRAIVAAHRRGREVVYVRPIWRWIMAIVTHLPEAVFKRMKM